MHKAFVCSNFEHCRPQENAGKRESVEYINSIFEENPERMDNEESDSELKNLSQENLVTHIRKFRLEILSKNSVLSSFEALTEDLASNLDAVATVLTTYTL